uniref:Uncharacterized protein n=1 Tax=Liagora brachyclada TaxID=1884665 RepID=A0A1G4NZV8_9FLOR|nr:Hypothetical protein ORF_2 [Liagora brachyclada]SCW24172.1 Hypothetical protein ORF_2 [Liagora brachyclada]
MPFISYLNTFTYSLPNQELKTLNSSQVNHSSILYGPGHKLLLKIKGPIKSKNLVMATESLYRFSKLQDSRPQLFQELLDKYWRQTIFLSNATPLVRKYSALLAKQEDSLVKNSKKKFMSSFSKALEAGDISVDLVANKSQLDNFLPDGSIRYIWGKSLNIRLPNYFNGLWCSKRLKDVQMVHYNNLMQNLQNNNFPVFVLANRMNQIVVAEPSNQLIHQNNIFHKVSLWYYDRFLWKKDDSSVYEGWFFVNPKDAEEYANFIKSRYPRSSHQNGLSVKSTTLKSYYSLNRNAPPRTEFRLFPDLEEVGRLVVSSKYRKGLSFDNKQTYGQKYFQGQPVYLIQSVLGTDKETGVKSDINYHYEIPADTSGTKYKGIFLNKTVAVNAWKQFCDKNSAFKLPSQPKLLVYNLEDFLKDYENDEQSQYRDFLFVPSEEVYSYIKSAGVNKVVSQNLLFKKLIVYRFAMSLWFQRLLWSLTSKQPPNW